jgi:hypothetical protein
VSENPLDLKNDSATVFEEPVIFMNSSITALFSAGMTAMEMDKGPSANGLNQLKRKGLTTEK